MLFISGKLEPTSKYNNMRLCSLDAQFPHWRHLLAFYFLIVTFLCVSENTSGSKVEKHFKIAESRPNLRPPDQRLQRFRWIARFSQPVWESQSLQRILSLLKTSHLWDAQEASLARRIKSSQWLPHWLLLMQSSSGFTLSSPWMTKLLIQSPKIPTLQWWRGLYAWVIPGAVLSGPTGPYSPG